MSWVLFSVLAAAIFALCVMVDKFMLTKWVRNPLVASVVFQVIAVLSGFGIWWARGFPVMSFADMLLAVLGGTSLVFMVVLYFMALKLGEASSVIPLFWTNVPITALLGWIFLGENFSPCVYVGVVLVTAGAMLISSHGISFHSKKAITFIFLSGLCNAFSVVITKYLSNRLNDFWSAFALTRLGMAFASIPFIIILFPGLMQLVRERGKRVIVLMVWNESMNLVAVVLSYIALVIGYASLVNALTALQPLFVFMFAVLASVFIPKILKEEISGSSLLLKFIAISLMFGGVLFIT